MTTYEDVDRGIYHERLLLVAQSPLRPILVELAAALAEFQLAHPIAARYAQARYELLLASWSAASVGWCTKCRQIGLELPQRYCVETTRHCSKLDSDYDVVSWDEAVTEIHWLCSTCRGACANLYPCELRDGYWWCGLGEAAWVPRRPTVHEFTLKTLDALSTAQQQTLERRWGLLPALGLSPSDVTGPCRVWIAAHLPLVTGYTADATHIQAVLEETAMANSHLGATSEQLAKMIGPWTNCPHCGAGPGYQERRNHNMTWGDADIHCSLCHGYVRSWDAS